MSGLELLRRTTLFAGVPEAELQALAQRLGKRTFARGMVIFHKGSPGQSLYLIESGEVRIFVLSETGHEITINLHGPGECFGELALLDGQPRSAGAMAMERTVAYTLERDAFLCCLDDYPQLTRRLLELVTDRLRHITVYAESLAFLDVPGRVAAVLLDLAARHGVENDGIELDLHLTQAELATWVAATREMVNKVLGLFREQRLIEIEGQAITILDSEGLRHKILY